MSEKLLEHENYTVHYHDEKRVFEAIWRGTVDQKSLSDFYKATIPLLEAYSGIHVG